MRTPPRVRGSGTGLRKTWRQQMPLPRGRRHRHCGGGRERSWLVRALDAQARCNGSMTLPGKSVTLWGESAVTDCDHCRFVTQGITLWGETATWTSVLKPPATEPRGSRRRDGRSARSTCYLELRVPVPVFEESKESQTSEDQLDRHPLDDSITRRSVEGNPQQTCQSQRQEDHSR